MVKTLCGIEIDINQDNLPWLMYGFLDSTDPNYDWSVIQQHKNNVDFDSPLPRSEVINKIDDHFRYIVLQQNHREWNSVSLPTKTVISEYHEELLDRIDEVYGVGILNPGFTKESAKIINGYVTIKSKFSSSSGVYSLKMEDHDWGWQENYVCLNTSSYKFFVKYTYTNEANEKITLTTNYVKTQFMFAAWNSSITLSGLLNEGGWIKIATDADHAQVSGNTIIIGKEEGNKYNTKTSKGKGENIRVIMEPVFVYDSPANVNLAWVESDHTNEDLSEEEEEVIGDEGSQALYSTLGEMKEEWAAKIQEYELKTGINFSREIYTVGDRGRWPAWMNEQLAILGAPYSADAFAFTHETYGGVLFLKSYFKEINPALYDALELDEPCLENFHLTGRHECNGVDENGVSIPGPCGCFSIGSLLFAEYSDELSDSEPTDRWDELLFENSNPKTSKSAIDNITISNNLNPADSQYLYLSSSDYMSFRVKPGWELVLTVGWCDSNQNDLSGEYWSDDQGSETFYRLGSNDLFGIGPGSNIRVGVSSSSPIPHHSIFFKPGADRVTNRESIMKPNELNVINNHHASYKLKVTISTVRSPFNEWLGGGTSLPPKWGVHTGISGATAAAKKMRNELKIPWDVFAEFRLGYELEVVFIFTVSAGLAFRFEYHGDKQEMHVKAGVFLQAGASIPGVASAEGSAVHYPPGYRLRMNNFSADFNLMIRDLFNQMIPDQFHFRTPGLSHIKLPSATVAKASLTVEAIVGHKYATEFETQKKGSPSQIVARKRMISYTMDMLPQPNHLEVSWLSNYDEHFTEIEIFFGYDYQYPKIFSGANNELEKIIPFSMNILRDGLSSVLIPLGITTLAIADEDDSGGPTELAYQAIQLLTNSAPLAVVNGVPDGLFKSLKQFVDKTKALKGINLSNYVPNIKSTKWANFEFAVAAGLVVKLRLLHSQDWDNSPVKQIVDGAGGNMAEIKSKYLELGHHPSNSVLDFGFRGKGSVKWAPKFPKTPIPPCGPLVRSGVIFSIEAGGKFDLFASNILDYFDVEITPAQTWSELEQRLIQDWAFPDNSGGGGS